MNLNPARFFRRALGIKASPLRCGDTGPYVFIHINKTAGTSVGRAINLPIKDHLSAQDVIAERIGIDAEQPHLNATRRARFRNYFDDETRAIVAHWFREDIEVFGYSFDGDVGRSSL